MVLKLSWDQKRMFWTFEKGIFQFFGNFWVTKLKPFSGKVKESVQNYLNRNFVIGNYLGNGFEATLSSKTNVLNVWKGHFSVFWKFLSDEVKTIFWESEGKRSKLFKSKFGHKKLLRKWFRSYLELKNKCYERLKRAFFSFLQIFGWQSWNHFLGKRENVAKNFSIKSALFRVFFEMLCSLYLITLDNRYYNFWILVFSIFIWIFSWSLSNKIRKLLTKIRKNYLNKKLNWISFIHILENIQRKDKGVVYCSWKIICVTILRISEKY